MSNFAFKLTFLLVLTLNLYENFKHIHTQDFTIDERKILTRQLITTTLLFLVIFLVISAGFDFTPIILGVVLMLLIYLNVSIFTSGISLIPFRGSVGPLRGEKAFMMGILIMLITLGIVLYNLLNPVFR